MQRIHLHFSKIADKYKDLRTTDPEPILLIRKKLRAPPQIEAADVGCGVGRYCSKLFDYFGGRLYLVCIDYCRGMLSQLVNDLKEKKIRDFVAINASGDALPLSTCCVDAVFSFNSVHHFEISKFLKESSRILKSNRHLFIYTRLRNQNKTNIWGRFFPDFYEKETRLYELGQLEQALKQVPSLRLERTEYFTYRRRAKLEWLITQARCHHYSTFCLYEEREFEEALKTFQQLVTRHFKDTDNVVWHDQNTMLVIRKIAP